MATVPTITTIQKTECIGNSLVTINTNYENIKNSFTTVNTDINNINDTLDNLITFTDSVSSAQLAKGWVKFSGRFNIGGSLDLTNSERKRFNSYNVKSVTRLNTGQYLVTLDKSIGTEFLVNGFVQPYYSGSGTFQGTDFTVVNLDETIPFPSPGDKSCRIVTRNLLGALVDPTIVCLTFYNY